MLADDKQNEMIVMGKGIGFQKNNAKTIDFSKVDKTFILNKNGVSEKLLKILNEVPTEHLETANTIIEMATKELKKDLNDNIYITLTDHISFAHTRYKQGLIIKNPLHWEIKKFYPEEFKVAIKAIELINKQHEVELPEDEASSISLHFVNAQQDGQGMEETVKMTKMINNILNIVKYQFGIQLNEDSINYTRFMTHLRYFAYRVFRKEYVPEDDDTLYDLVSKKYPEAYKCAETVLAFIEKTYHTRPTKEEMVYFMIHIHRVTNREENIKTGL